MIPTKYRMRLPKGFSYPIGAEALSEDLADSPLVSRLTVSFNKSPVWPHSEFRRIIRERSPYAIFAAEFIPASRPGYSGSNAMIETGWFEESWNLQVNPVDPRCRATAHRLLREQGLPLVARWLDSSRAPGWTSRVRRLQLVFDPAGESIQTREHEGA